MVYPTAVKPIIIWEHQGIRDKGIALVNQWTVSTIIPGLQWPPFKKDNRVRHDAMYVCAPNCWFSV